MVISQLGIKNGDYITVRKLKVNEEIVEAPLLTPDRKSLNPKLVEIFKEWFIIYSAPGTEVMNDQSVADFINVATRDNCERDDKRVA